jgi:predicted alpha-1,2-mannosidase
VHKVNAILSLISQKYLRLLKSMRILKSVASCLLCKLPLGFTDTMPFMTLYRSFIVLSLPFLLTLYARKTLAQPLTSFVDPFIGTANAGHTHPGAVCPWGMVSVAPHNRLKGATCYAKGEPYLYGFGHLQLSGVGCPDAGSLVLKPISGSLVTALDQTQSAYSGEVAQAGYYAVTLDRFGIRASMTATPRSGLSRYAFGAGQQHILIDVSHSLSTAKDGQIRWVSGTELEGYKLDGNFCDSRLTRKVFFVVQLSRKPTHGGTFTGQNVLEQRNAAGTAVGAFATYEFARPDSVEVRVGLSFVSIANARLNLQTEQKNQSFEQIRQRAAEHWQRELARIQVEGGSVADKTKFYTALYHCLLTPSVYNDVNGDYLTAQTDSTAPRRVRRSNYPRYSVFSLWDTYRTLHPLLCLLYPQQQNDMVRSMVDIYKEGGWLPKWEIYGQESWVMVGDPALPVIADTYLKGIRQFDVQQAYQAMRRRALQTSPQNLQRPGNAPYRQYGYVPIDRRGGTDSTLFSWTNGYVWGAVSTSLEYHYADWTLAQLARSLGKTADHKQFLAQSMRYQSLFDSTTGFLRPRRADGRWLTPFNPLARTYDIRWAKSGGHGYVEGTAWAYRFFVPHDVSGLARLYGPDRFVRHLQTTFDSLYYDMSNEPGLSYPYLFNYVPGQAWRTQKTVRHCIQTYFNTTPGGIPGNDDAGTMSAWLVFSMLGFYPDCPGTNRYQLTTPTFDRATLTLDRAYYPAGTFTLTTTGTGHYLKPISTEPGKIPAFELTHERLRQGGTLNLERVIKPTEP